MSIKIYSLCDGAYNASVRRLSSSTSDYQKYIKQLSSGIKINSAGDDAAGLYLSTKLNTALMANGVAKNNTQTGINMLNTADGALGGMMDSLQRIRNLAVQSANGVYSSKEREMLQSEITELAAGVKQNYDSATFGDKKLFDAPGTTNNIKPITQLSEASMSVYDNAHIIRNAADFVSKITGHESENFILSADVDLSSLGTKNNSIIANFSGQLDGNGYVVSGFNIDTGGAAVDNIGLFGTVSGTIKNLGIEGFSVSATNSNWTGGLVGQITGGTVDNCYANGSVSGNIRSGVLAGYNNAGTISYCYSGGDVYSATWSAGGLLGLNDNGATVSNCYSTASATCATLTAAGLVASNLTGSVVSESYVTGNVQASDNAGGVVGRNDTGASVTNCYATGNVSATNASAGGVVGWNNSSASVTNSYATGNVSASVWAGGVSGENEGSTDNTNFYKNNMSSDGGASIDGNASPLPTGSWDTAIWDLSSAMPTLKKLNGAAKSSGSATTLQVGSDVDGSAQIDINMAFSLGSLNFDVKNADSALTTIDQVDKMISFLSEQRTNLGAQSSKLENVLTTQDNRMEGYSAAKSNIMDTDMAYAQSQVIKNNLLQNFATGLFRQSKNVSRDLVLSLLQG